MHSPVPTSNELVHRPSDTGEEIGHDAVAPVRRRAVRVRRRATIASDLVQHGLDERAGVRDHRARPADLRHSRGDQVSLDEFNRDTVLFEFRSKRSRPLLQERLAAGVRRQEGSGEETAERSHSQDQTTLALDHARDNKLRGAQSTETIDRDDIRHFLLGGHGEGSRHVVALSDVVDQHGDVELVNDLLQLVEIFVIIARKVHGYNLGLRRWRLGHDLFGECSQFRGRPRHEEDIVSGTSELEGEFLAQAIGGSCDNSPAAFGTE